MPKPETADTKTTRTPFPHLLDSFTVPLNRETDAITAYIDNSRAELIETEQRIERLLKRAKVLGSAIETHTGMISTLRRIPPEILLEIFHFASPRFDDTSVVKGKGKCRQIWDDPPWILGGVCRKWRETALGCPALWSDVRISSHCWKYVSGKLFFKALPIFLSRSRDASIHVRVIYGDPYMTDSNVNAVWNVLSPHLHRCHSLNLPAVLVACLRDTLNLGFSTPSSLGLGPNSSTNSTNLLLLDFDASRLRTVEIDQYVRYLHPTLPWSQLTRLSIQAVEDFSTIFPILHTIQPNILILSLRFLSILPEDGESDQLDDSGSKQPPDQKLSFTSLHTLTLTGDHAPCYKTLEHITSPSLHTLDIDLSQPYIHVAANSMIKRSGCRIRSLRIRNWQLNAKTRGVEGNDPPAVSSPFLCRYLEELEVQGAQRLNGLLAHLRRLGMQTYSRIPGEHEHDESAALALGNPRPSRPRPRQAFYAQLRTLILRDVDVDVRALLSFLEDCKHASREASFHRLRHVKLVNVRLEDRKRGGEDGESDSKSVGPISVLQSMEVNARFGQLRRGVDGMRVDVIHS